MLYSFLKIKLYPACLSSQSRSKLVRHRHRIRQSIARMPSMAPLLDGLIAAAYTQTAERLTARARLPRSTLPENLPYTKEQLLDKEFMPWMDDHLNNFYDEYTADACPRAVNEKAADP